jgi:AbrB family looped-hinge helix DNA binding protein
MIIPMDTKQTTKVTKRGQTVIPALIRKRYSIQPGDRLAWIDDGEIIKVIPVPSDPIRAFRGRGRGENLLEALLRDRKAERDQ